jgi:flagellar biogenesis protein FliO
MVSYTFALDYANDSISLAKNALTPSKFEKPKHDDSIGPWMISLIILLVIGFVTVMAWVVYKFGCKKKNVTDR